jgi:hypothetical protein
MKSYGQRCIRMPPLRGGQSLVHLCLTATIESAAARRINHPVLVGRRTGTRRASVGGKPRASRSLRHRSIVGRRRTEGSALATRAARCSLRSHSPLLPWRRFYRVQVRRWWGVARNQYRIGRVSLRSTRGRSLVPSYGRYRWRAQVGPYAAPGRTRSLKSLPSIQRIVSLTVGDDIFDRPEGCDDARPSRDAITPLPRCQCCRRTRRSAASTGRAAFFRSNAMSWYETSTNATWSPLPCRRS